MPENRQNLHQRNGILIARINGLLLLIVGVFWGFAQFTDFDHSLSVRALLAVGYWAIGVAGGALAYRGFSNALPPKK